MNGLDFDTWEKKFINGYDKILNIMLPHQLMNVTRHVFKNTIHDVSIYDWMRV